MRSVRAFALHGLARNYQAVDDAFAVDGEAELRRDHVYEVRRTHGARGR